MKARAALAVVAVLALAATAEAAWSPEPTFACSPREAGRVECVALHAFPAVPRWEVWRRGAHDYRDVDRGLVAYLEAGPGDLVKLIVPTGGGGRFSVARYVAADGFIRAPKD